MKRILLVSMLILVSTLGYSQCTTTNATGCQCKSPGQTDCDLLPDIQVGHPPFYVYDDDFGIKEFSQTGNADPDDDGRLYVTVSTPNPGFGPLEIYTTDTFVCGTDTFVGTAPSICPDGISYPRILIMQRIYHKNVNSMTSWVRPAGTMTYHPSHSHMHVDNWGTYTLRTRDTLEPNPLNWPMVGTGTKLAFCVMDYGDCSGYPDHCLDSLGNSLNNNADFPNYGLGGGQYSCSPSVQGISSGYVDIYWTTLDGMWVEVPPGLCNGEYYIVCEVDPNQNFLEEDETNNVYAAPFIMKKQSPNPAYDIINVNISSSGTDICQGESVTLSASINMSNLSFQWSNGDTTQFTTVSTSGTYTVNVSNSCGTGVSVPVQVNVLALPASPVGINDTIPVPGTATLTATAANDVSWFDAPSGGNLLYTGNSFITPFLNTSETFYAETFEDHVGASFSTGLPDNSVGGAGGYSNTDQALIFDCYNTFTLHTVNAYAQNSGNIVIELLDANDNVLQSLPVNVFAGVNVITVDFVITPGTGYQLTRTGDALYRNNPQTNVGYPFTVTNYLSITGSTAGSGFYYFFYDWVIKLPDNSCSSARTPVEAIVSIPNAIADVAVMNSLRVFPNPAQSSLNVKFHSAGDDAIIEMIDALGKSSLRREIFSGDGSYDISIDVSQLAKGVYNLHILTSGKNVYKKVVVN